MAECYTCQLPRFSEDDPNISEDVRRFPRKFRRIRKRKQRYTFCHPSPSGFATHNHRSGVSALLNRESRDESTVIFMDFSILALVRAYIYFKRVSDKYNSLKF